MIFFLAKVFQQSEHTDAFLRGEMFANRLSYFKKIEGHDGRGDENEGAIMPQIDNLILKLESMDLKTGGIDGVTLTADDFSAPPIIHPGWFDHINIFCMYAAYIDGVQGISSDGLQEFKSRLEIPTGYSMLGKHAVVVTNTTEFLRRVKLAADRAGYGIGGKLVRYFDPAVGTPLSRWDVETIFTKRTEYEYQREFRLAINTRTNGCCPVILHIGAIKDIATRIDTDEINRQLNVGWKQ